MTPQEAAPIISALNPLIERVRTDKTAVKMPDGSSRWTGDALTPALMAKHLNGGPARGVCPIHEGQSVTLAALLDFDSHKGEVPWSDMVALAAKIHDHMEAKGYPSTVFRSSGGSGIHMIFIWDDPQDAASVRAALREGLAEFKLRDGAGGVKAGQVEVFPKQDEVHTGGYGNQFILPLAGKSEWLDPMMDFEVAPRHNLAHWHWPRCKDVPAAPQNTVFVSGSELVSGAGSRSGEPPEDLEKVRSALDAIPNDGVLHDPDYEEWFRIGCAVHEATGGSVEGLEAFQAWSAQSPKHDAEFTEKRVWRYMRGAAGRGSAITRASLFALASKFGWVWLGGINTDGFEDVPDSVIAENERKSESAALAVRQESTRASFEAKAIWKIRVEEAVDEAALIEDVCPQIARDKSLSEICRDALAELVKARLVAFGTKVNITHCRKLVAPVVLRKVEESDCQWAQDWVFVTDRDQFFQLGTESWLTMTGFNATFNREIPTPADGSLKKTAAWTALEDVRIETAARAHYVPWLGPKFTFDGQKCVNLYSPASVPEAAPALTPAGVKARDTVLRHLNLLCAGRQEVVDVLVSWLAHNVQHPGRKIRWAPLIKGIEGDGKSLIGKLLEGVMGTKNVKNISPTVLSSNFTEWAMGACVGLMEEIRLAGHNRYDVLNALKPFVTNDSVAIHPKGRNEFQTLNTMNYVAFTNHGDALPLNDCDRRWFVVFTPFADRQQFIDAVGGDAAAYFRELFSVIEGHRGELRRWLLDFQIPTCFDANGVAPSTDEKAGMVAMSVSEDEELIQSVIEAGAVGVGKTVLSSACLTTAIKNLGLEVEAPHTSALSRALIKMGWVRFPKSVKWRGEAHRVWVRGVKVTDTEGVRTMLEVTSASAPEPEKISVAF